ncbi:MAG: glycosyltransferase, partial [Ignavibacteriales bacterium]|nr:glycosyltransferase [Ignavibacteriales bacterium]
MNMIQKSFRNVLVIAYYFPPLGLSGVQRTLKFVKYLPQFGWQPTVLTVTPTGYYAQDYTLLDELHPQHIAIERVGSLDPNRLFRHKGVVRMPSERWRKIFTFISDTFFIPDNKIGWKRKALKKAEGLFRKKNFDVIFATAPPFTDFLIGKELHKKFNKPLVIDYRDPWHEYPYKYYPTPLHKLWNYKLEKKVLKASSRILVTSRKTKELILKRFKFLHYNDITILPHGYDPLAILEVPLVVVAGEVADGVADDAAALVARVFPGRDDVEPSLALPDDLLAAHRLFGVWVRHAFSRQREMPAAREDSTDARVAACGDGRERYRQMESRITAKARGNQTTKARRTRRAAQRAP